jgi:hypothetical protein
MSNPLRIYCALYLEWVEATMTRLYLGKVGLVLGGLQRMQAQSDEAAKAIANCWDY